MIRATTELDAVNSMLATIGEAPVSTLESSMHADAAMARQTLAQVSKEVQAEGWYFNVETEYPLHPDSGQEIKLPENVAGVDVEPQHRTREIDVVQRGQRHTCASRLVQNGIPIQIVKEFLGHSTIQTTMRYAHLCSKQLFEVVDRLETA